MARNRHPKSSGDDVSKHHRRVPTTKAEYERTRFPVETDSFYSTAVAGSGVELSRQRDETETNDHREEQWQGVGEHGGEVRRDRLRTPDIGLGWQQILRVRDDEKPQ